MCVWQCVCCVVLGYLLFFKLVSWQPTKYMY